MPAPGPIQEREDRFVAAYVRHLNASRAVREAGYPTKQPGRQGMLMLQRPRVQAAIRAKQAEQLKAYDLDANAIKRELFAIATCDPGKCFDSEGRPLPIHEIPPEVRAAIKTVRIEVFSNGSTRASLEFWCKVDALHLAAKHLALLAPKEVNVNVRFPHAHLSDEELRQKLLESANTIDAQRVEEPSQP